MTEGPNPPQNQPEAPVNAGANATPGSPNPNNTNNRRRRRRRGGKKQASPGASNGQTAAPQPRRNNPRQSGGGGSTNNGGAQRRSNRGRRPGPAFVGPMDHSYRASNPGNIDTTSQNFRQRREVNGNLNANGNIASKNIDPQMAPVVTLNADSPARIFCFVDDLFFLAKIQETSRKLGIKVEFVKSVEPILDRAGDEIPEDERPSLVIFDLNNLAIKSLALIPKLRSKLKKTTSIIGFVSHIQGDLKMKAQEAGCDMVMPRSAFSQNLPNLLRRHGAPDEVYNDQQP